MEAAVGNRGGAWREAFLNRRRNDLDATEDLGGTFDGSARKELRETRSSKLRNTSRRQSDRAAGRAGADAVSSEHAEAAKNLFNQQAVLDQDRALIEQLTQRPARERAAVRKPPPPPKVTPYRARADGKSFTGELTGMPEGGDSGRQSPNSLWQASGESTSSGAALGACQAELSPSPVPQDTCSILSAALAAHDSAGAPEVQAQRDLRAQGAIATGGDAYPSLSVAGASVVNGMEGASGSMRRDPLAERTTESTVSRVVPKVGELFSAQDIDGFMDQLGDGKNPTAFAPQKAEVESEHWRAHFSAELLKGDCLHGNQEDRAPATASTACPGTSGSVRSISDSNRKALDDFQIPDRRALREQINAIDAWLEVDTQPRSSKRGTGGDEAARQQNRGFSATAQLTEALDQGIPPEEFLQSLEEIKRRKRLGEIASQITLKGIATKAKPHLPLLKLEDLVRTLQLFASARYQDHDLYLRTLGEIPMQIRGIAPEMLTQACRILWRLRLHEQTYLELFSMEAMNMIRATKRSAPRMLRRPAPGTRTIDPTDTPGGFHATSSSTTGQVPTPPSMPRTPPSSAPSPELPAPFDTTQLVHLGNSLARLSAKHPTRFMEVFQDQLALAIPLMSRDDCERVCPTLAMSQLMYDPLRRAFLERCAQVGAGEGPFPSTAGPEGGPAPDIATFQKDAELHRSRMKYYRNIYIVEASVRKETFSFFSSLSMEVRNYLDRLHAASSQLPHNEPTELAQQVAAVLEQLGAVCDLRRMAGPLSLHVVTRSTNPSAEGQEVAYECNDASAFYAAPEERKNTAPELTAFSKHRHKLLGRLGWTLKHINAWEWNQMSEANRINYMVKVQSFQ